jgi:hypothetical protein
MSEEIIPLKKRLVELDFNLRSCKDRVRDLEWEVEMSEPGEENPDLLNQRRRTLDKIKYLYMEMESVKKTLIDLGAEA